MNMTRGKNVKSPAIPNALHPVGRAYMEKYTLAFKQRWVISMINVDWPGFSGVVTRLYAAFLHSKTGDDWIANMHYTNIINLYHNYAEKYPGLSGNDIDRLNLILHYLKDQVTEDWLGITFQGTPVANQPYVFPGDSVLDHYEETDSSNQICIYDIMHGYSIGYQKPNSADLTADKKDKILSMLMTPEWLHYKELFFQPKKTASVSAFLQDAKLLRVGSGAR